MVRGQGVQPSQTFEPCGFSYCLRVSPPGATKLRVRVCGLDYTFTLSRMVGAQVAPASTHFLAELCAQDCHYAEVSFGQLCIAGFLASTQVFSQVRCVCLFASRTRRSQGEAHSSHTAFSRTRLS